MKKIDWEVFFGNSSTEEALCIFATHNCSFDEFSANTHCFGECQPAIKTLKNRGYKKGIRAAQKALLTRGFISYQEDFRNYLD